MRKIRIAAALLAGVMLASGCGSTTEPSQAPASAPAPQGSAPNAPQGQPSVTTSSAPALPTKLPKFTAGNVDNTVRTIIEMAAAYAVDVPSEDRQPEVKMVEGQIECIPGAVNIGLEKQIDACYPDGPDGEIFIAFSASGMWEIVEKDEKRGGGQLHAQDLVLSSYMNYLLFREGQRQKLMTSESEADRDKITKILFCRQGAVFWGLNEHGLVTEEHRKMYAFQRSKPDFAKGARGDC